jgi:hypothetical protein
LAPAAAPNAEGAPQVSTSPNPLSTLHGGSLVLQVEAAQYAGQISLGDDDEPVRLLHVGPDLAEEHIRRQADRTGEAFADLLAQGTLHLQGQFPGNWDLPLGAHQAAGHFVDRAHLLDRQAGVDGLQDAFVILGVEPVPRLHRNHGRTQVPRLAHQGAGLDAERLGRIAGGDRDRGIRRRLHDDDRLAA